MSEPAVLLGTFKLRPESDAAFHAWKARYDAVIGRFPGFISSDIIPPPQPGGNEWTLILNFRSREELLACQKSEARSQIVAEALHFLEGGSLGEVVPSDQAPLVPESSVTEVIVSKVKPGMADVYREWTVRIQAAQAKYPGYQGMYLQPPSETGGQWTTIIRYDTGSHLEAWMNSPERRDLLAESRKFIEHEELMRLATSFPGWVPVNPATGKGPPNWKTALLVLLGLFPVVMLEMRFLNPHLTALGLHASLATFIGNCLSVAITSFITMPLFVRGFAWWLFLDRNSPKSTTMVGVALLMLLFTAEIIVLWKLLPW